MKPSPELRRLASTVTRANAILVPLVGHWCHDGQPLPGREEALDRAVLALAEAYEIARSLQEASERPARCPDPRRESEGPK